MTNSERYKLNRQNPEWLEKERKRDRNRWMIPLFFELYDDRKGDDHAKNDDWILRGLLMIVSSVTCWLINRNHNFIQYFILSFVMFTVLFPYLINIILYKRGVISDPKWWSHLSKTAIPDKWIDFIHWIPRMIMYFIILALGIRLYTCWDFTAWNSCQ